MKICLLKNVKYDYTTVVKVEDDGRLPITYSTDTEYARLSETIDVEFPELSNDEVIKNEVTILDNQMAKVRGDCEAAITALEGRKQELLAIGCES